MLHYFKVILFVSLMAIFGPLTLAESAPTIEEGVETLADPEATGSYFCDLGAVSRTRGSFGSRSDADRFCSRFNQFCFVRQYGDGFYEADYRSRINFRGRGSSFGQARANAFDLYFNWFGSFSYGYDSRFLHEFIWGANCG